MMGFGIVWFLIIGLIAGFVAEKIMGGNRGLLMNLVVGVVGAVIGGFLAGVLGIHFAGMLGAIIIAIAGAVILLYVLRVLK